MDLAERELADRELAALVSAARAPLQDCSRLTAVRVEGLDARVDEQALRAFFADYGRVQHVEIADSAEGERFATVTWKYVSNAVA
eukprot:IDg20678t1